jgi:flagellum-specific ATP synthase
MTRILERLFIEAVETAPRMRPIGSVVRVVGTTVEAAGLNVHLGSICWIDLEPDGLVSAEVIGFRDGRITLVPFGEIAGIRPGSTVRLREQQFRVPVGRGLLGRVLDGFGRPIDGRGPLRAQMRVVGGTPPDPMNRARVKEPLSTGVRAIDGLMTAGKGQRLGIFAGSGVGKSTLLAMIARHATSDVNVIALIGERGREVDEVFLFLSEDFADVFGDCVFAQRLALPDAFAIGANGVALVLQVGTQHFFRLLRLLDRLRRGGRHAA